MSLFMSHLILEAKGGGSVVKVHLYLLTLEKNDDMGRPHDKKNKNGGCKVANLVVNQDPAKVGGRVGEGGQGE